MVVNIQSSSRIGFRTLGLPKEDSQSLKMISRNEITVVDYKHYDCWYWWRGDGEFAGEIMELGWRDIQMGFIYHSLHGV